MNGVNLLRGKGGAMKGREEEETKTQREWEKREAKTTELSRLVEKKASRPVRKSGD